MNNKISIKEETKHNYPDWIRRVTAGDGGESYLLIGTEKIALYDCGMAYCGDDLVDNIREELDDPELDGRSLDMIILTHSHYDHVGGLPYVMTAFPEATTMGGEYCAQVLHREGALRVIEDLGRKAAELYKVDPDVVTVDGMRIHETVEEGDVIDLGDHKLHAIYTPGHTKCSMAFMVEPEHFMLASETLGVLLPKSYEYQPLILKSYQDTIKTIAKCRAMEPEYLIMPHFGIVPEDQMDTFWDVAETMCVGEYEFVKEMCENGGTMQQILDAYTKRYFVAGRRAEQPIEAFYANAIPTIKMYAKELGYVLR